MLRVDDDREGVSERLGAAHSSVSERLRSRVGFGAGERKKETTRREGRWKRVRSSESGGSLRRRDAALLRTHTHTHQLL